VRKCDLYRLAVAGLCAQRGEGGEPSAVIRYQAIDVERLAYPLLCGFRRPSRNLKVVGKFA
jgi:hypothetical protein